MSKHITLENLNVALPPIKHLIDKKAENVDWNENDPAASGYIKNRPFYSYNEAVNGEYIFYETAFTGEQQGDNLYVTGLPESSFDFETLARLFPIESDLENADFVVVYDNETYEIKCFVYEGMPYLGNLNIMGGLGEDTGEPFLFLFNGGIGVTTPGEHTISVKTADTIEKKYVKIDEKYLPELVVVDDSLSNYGMAADAGTTGEAINTLQDLVGDVQVSTQISRAINSYDHIGKRGTGSKAEIFNNAKEASGTYSHAEGYNTTASGNYSHAEGSNTTASGNYSHAEGYNTIASNYYSHAEGYNTTASANYSHAEGHQTTANGQGSHAEGYMTIANGQGSHAEGYMTIANNHNSHAEGRDTIAFGANSHAEGHSTLAKGAYSHAEGWGRTQIYKITGEGNAITYTINDMTAIAVGKIITLNNICAKIESYNIDNLTITLSNTLSSTSISNQTVTIYNSMASGDYSHTEGSGTIASGRASHAEGESTDASNTNSHAEGSNTTASGHSSHAEGSNTTASGNYSHAQGFYTRAQGNYSSASGMHTRATNQSLHVIGEYNLIEEPSYSVTTGETKGNSLIAWGSTVLKIIGTPQFNENTGIFTFDGVTSVSANSLSVGDCILKDAGATTSSITGKIYWKYEGIRNSKYIFTIYTSFSPFENRGKYVHMIGNGTSDATRSNAHTLDWDGLGWFAGGLKVGGTGQDDTAAKDVMLAPTAATVGQVIAVKTVDENGKPTTWETIDPWVITSPNGTQFKLTINDEGILSAAELV